MKKCLYTILLATALTLTAFAAPIDTFKNLKGTLDIAGGTAHIPVMQQAARNIMTANSNIRITVAGGGSGVGVKQVGEGLVGIGNTGRPLRDGEVSEYGLKTFPFAIDGVAVAVNPANSVRELTTKQIADIFAGKVTDWQDVGGKPGRINVYSREDGSGTRETFTEKIMGTETLATSANVVNSNGAMKTAVAQDARAIGYVGIGHLDKSIAGITVDGMIPTQDNAADGTYKVVRDLFMNTKGEPTGLVAAFIDYIFSDDGAKIIAESGYIPIPKK